MTQDTAPEILAELHCSLMRRVLGVGLLVVLGVLLLTMAVQTQPSPLWRVALAAFALGALWMAGRMWQATSRHLVLTREALCDDQGRVLVRMEDVAEVNRGAFAIKPSNGFMLRCHARQQAAFCPGLWWRWRRYVAVGGVTPGGPGKSMAELIDAARRGALPEA